MGRKPYVAIACVLGPGFRVPQSGPDEDDGTGYGLGATGIEFRLAGAFGPGLPWCRG